MYSWKWQRVELEFFSPNEFDHPELMDPDFLRIIDEWRRRCGFKIKVLDDARTLEEHRRLYQKEIAAGGRLPNSSHLRGRALDCRPLVPSEASELTMVRVATEMWHEGVWPYLGLEVATRHLHVDNDEDLARQGLRPMLFAGASR